MWHPPSAADVPIPPDERTRRAPGVPGSASGPARVPEPMTICRATRLLVPALLVSVAVTSLTGSERYGWLAAALTFAVMVVVQGVRGTAAACPMAPSSGVERSPEHDRSPDTAPQVPTP